MKRPGRTTATDPESRRCAIYTRKSTAAGLEQDFNSLDAQREACAAYIGRQPGWTLVDDRYDDGGFTGANIERPAFQRLLADIEAGKIDVVVVYKVDRLSRSLLDFAKLMERFGKAGASFVSVTQNFSTADAMGRLTLNMLMSFAEFEREMIGERTRDKIAAQRRRGKWTGGTVPLGYTRPGQEAGRERPRSGSRPRGLLPLPARAIDAGCGPGAKRVEPVHEASRRRQRSPPGGPALDEGAM